MPEVFSQSSSPPLRLALEREYPLFTSPLLPSSPHLLPLSGRPARGIQSDSDPKWSSACRFSAGCCHGTVQSDLLYPSLLKKTRAPSGRPPLAFSRSSLDSLLAGFLFFFLILDVALLHTQPPHLRDRQVTMLLEESVVSFFSPPFSLLLKSVWVASWRHYSLFSPSISSMCCSFLPGSSWADTACTGPHFRAAYSLGATDCVSTSWTPFLWWSGWASLLAGEEHLRGLWVSARCMLSSFVSLGFTKSWVGQVALRSPINRHALDLAVSLDDQGH